ncbi:hypothetical protein SAMN05660841_02623 [Sphingobacterium nematocida]|uniref:Uncharacterized protein n=2 Tax=Sphingobacterium nematocida TaxID=1513896 RepID=A0A1T5EK59_9SPHI|nr:hypothetical protein SAMN05660841_02623 [Sphingobacterium nematocida]
MNDQTPAIFLGSKRSSLASVKNNMRIYLLFLFCIGSAYAQPGGQITVGFADRYDSLPTLDFKPAAADRYEKLSAAPPLVQTGVTLKKNEITVPTAQGGILLKPYDDQSQGDGFRGWEYKGYLPIPKMHALVSQHVSEHLGFSDMVLLDSISATRYVIASIGDGAVEVPIPSPKGQFLVYYYNYVYERNSCFVGVLRIAEPNNSAEFRLAELMSFQTKDWAVKDIRWIDDHSFIVKAYTVQRTSTSERKQYAYYLAKINI